MDKCILEILSTFSLECSSCNIELGKEAWQSSVEFGVEQVINFNMHDVRIGTGCVETTEIKVFKVWPIVQGDH